MDLDTTFRSPGSWGARAQSFLPTAVAREPGAPNVDLGPGYQRAMDGTSAHPNLIKVPPKTEFVAGGWNRGTALAHLRRGEEDQIVCEGGVLGEAFNDYLSSFPPDELGRLYKGYTEGVDAWSHLDAEAQDSLRPVDADQLSARRHRVPTRSEVWNSPTVTEHLEAACGKMTADLESGACKMLGLVEDVARQGLMPLHLNPLTMETTKKRLCVNHRKLNAMSEWPKSQLDGLQTIEDQVRGRPAYGAVSDETSGYHHHLLSEDSQELFGVVFLGYVFVYRALTFGWGPSCYYHQARGLVTVGYHRLHGGLVQLYIGKLTRERSHRVS